MKKLIAIVLLSVASLVQAQTEVAGVKYENSISLAGSQLQLNGAGVRYKAVFKVYALGMYLPKKTTSALDAVQQTGPKRLHVVMLREIDANELGKLFTRAIEDEIPRQDLAKVIGPLTRMGQMFGELKTLNAGDAFTIDWIPGTGTVISVRGKPQGEAYKEPEFNAAMMNIWLGKTPADARLKDAILKGDS
jgi:Chalcone isomerase-like